MILPIYYGQIKNVPNHQPDFVPPFFWCSLETSEVFDRHHMYLLEENPNFPMCLWLKDLKDGMPDPDILVVWYFWGHHF